MKRLIGNIIIGLAIARVCFPAHADDYPWTRASTPVPFCYGNALGELDCAAPVGWYDLEMPGYSLLVSIGDFDVYPDVHEDRPREWVSVWNMGEGK